jgi:hypothetical protein
VIYCSDRAIANGFSYTCAHEWSNLGQGAPEVGAIPGAPARLTSIPMPEDSLEYAPTTGVKGARPARDRIYRSNLTLRASVPLSEALREAVANLYNVTYRKNKASQYTYENVCIVPGGRAGLSRVAAVIGDVYTVSCPSHTFSMRLIHRIRRQSYQIPDYTAYDQVLGAFRRLVPVPTAYGFILYFLE